MPLPPFMKRAARDGEAAGVMKPEPAALVQARRRLIGAAVLLAVGVVVFPLFFEGKPRPLPTDLPLTYAPTALRGADAPPVAPEAASDAEPLSPPVASVAPAAVDEEISGESSPSSPPALSSAAAVSPQGVAAAAASKPSSPSNASKAPNPSLKPPAKPNGPPPSVPAAGDPSTREAATARYIIQVGAFADPAAAREVRLKVERLGFVTYTHVIDVPEGQRIRVRVGPMTDRAQAQRTLDKIKQAGLPAALLTL